MATWREKMDEMVKELQQERDELRVKAALGKAELKEELAEFDVKVREELADLDAKFDDAKKKTATWADKADDQIDDIMDDAREKTSGLLKELKEGYQKLRDRLDRDERPNA